MDWNKKMTKINVLDKGFIEIKEIHGTDLTVVNGARVSMGKEVDEFTEKDSKLIDYLAKNKHYSPFRHCGILFHMKMPIFVMRQFVKHRFGVEINEISGRYTEFNENEYYTPEHFRFQSKDNKQGSEGEMTDGENVRNLILYTDSHKVAFDTYRRMLDNGIAKEMARMVLPVSIYTEIRVTMSLQAIQNFISLRDHSHAQWEIQKYAVAMKELAIEAFPYSMKALLEYSK